MPIIIGIDPGSRTTGYGIIRAEKNQNIYVSSGSFSLSSESNVHNRLQKIYLSIQEVIQLYQPDEASIEQIFMHENPGSALKLGQARGAAIVALTMPIAEYSARQVKQSVVGYGAAKKDQVQHMVKRLLNYSGKLQADEADALAIALCHSFNRTALVSAPRKRKRSTSWRNFQP